MFYHVIFFFFFFLGGGAWALKTPALSFYIGVDLVLSTSYDLNDVNSV